MRVTYLWFYNSWLRYIWLTRFNKMHACNYKLKYQILHSRKTNATTSDGSVWWGLVEWRFIVNMGNFSFRLRILFKFVKIHCRKRASCNWVWQQKGSFSPPSLIPPSAPNHDLVVSQPLIITYTWIVLFPQRSLIFVVAKWTYLPAFFESFS